MPIHPTAIIDRSAEIDPTADVGAYAIVEAQTKIGPGCRLWPHAYVSWGTTLGARVQIHPFAVVGHEPQDFGWKGTPSYTQIGDDTIVREHATVHRGTIPDSTTIVGRACMLMSTSHVAHNCVVGDNVVLVNGGLLAGHVHLGNRAFIAGNAGVHQFVRIGDLVMVRGTAGVPKDVPPFMMVGPRGVHGLNIVGMRRAGLTSEERLEIRRCHKLLYRAGLYWSNAVEQVTALVQTPAGRRLVEFLAAPSRRGYLRLQMKAHADVAAFEEVE